MDIFENQETPKISVRKINISQGLKARKKTYGMSRLRKPSLYQDSDNMDIQLISPRKPRLRLQNSKIFRPIRSVTTEKISLNSPGIVN
jgi:hypothetical protein